MACYQNVVKTQAPKTKIKTKTSTLSLETSRDQDSIKSQEPHHWILSAVVGPVYIELNPKCELSCSNDFRDKQEVLKLMVGALAPYVPYLFKMKFVHKVHQVNDKKG